MQKHERWPDYLTRLVGVAGDERFVPLLWEQHNRSDGVNWPLAALARMGNPRAIHLLQEAFDSDANLQRWPIIRYLGSPVFYDTLADVVREGAAIVQQEGLPNYPVPPLQDARGPLQWLTVRHHAGGFPLQAMTTDADTYSPEQIDAVVAWLRENDEDLPPLEQ